MLKNSHHYFSKEVKILHQAKTSTDLNTVPCAFLVEIVGSA